MTTDSDPPGPPSPSSPPSPSEPAGGNQPDLPDRVTEATADSTDDTTAANSPADEQAPADDGAPPPSAAPPGNGFGTRPGAWSSPSGGDRRPGLVRSSARLQRSSSDKVLTGVCGGLGRHTGVDPILFRIGFVALVFAAGSGILLYIALAILMPRDDGQQIWSRAGGLPQFMPAAPGAPDIRIGDREREQAVAYVGAALREGRLDLTEYDERVATAYQAKTASELHALTADLQPPGGHAGPRYGAPAPRALPMGPRSPVPGVTLAILLIGLGLLALGDRYAGWSLDPSTYFGIALATVGLALLVSAFGPWRRSKAGLITVGLILSIGLFVTSAVDSRGGFDEATFGERNYRPVSAEQIRDTYQVLMGQSTLDLSGLRFNAENPTEIQINVTMGNFEILVPQDIDVRLSGDATFGSVSTFGDREYLDGYYPGVGDGTDVGDDEPELILDIDVRFGNAEVTRVG